MDPLKPGSKRWKIEDRRVKPEVRGVGVAADSEEAEVLQPDPGDRPVAKVANSAVQPRQVAGHHRHVSRMAGGMDVAEYENYGSGKYLRSM